MRFERPVSSLAATNSSSEPKTIVRPALLVRACSSAPAKPPAALVNPSRGTHDVRDRDRGNRDSCRHLSHEDRREQTANAEARYRGDTPCGHAGRNHGKIEQKVTHFNGSGVSVAMLGDVDFIP